MALNFGALNTAHEIFDAAIAGIPRVAEMIAAVPLEQRSKALDAAQQSYQKTAKDLGYDDGDAQQWASELISQLSILLRLEQDIASP
jgi:hypothetical protein